MKTVRPPMTLAQYYIHCARCPFLKMPTECIRAQQLKGYCPNT